MGKTSIGRFARILGLRVRSLFSRAHLETELSEELQYHFDRQIEVELANGRSPEEARFAALRSMRDLAQYTEQCRDARRLNWLDNAMQDLRYALLQLRKSPVFAVAAVALLAFGVAAAVTLFAFVDAALIRPLPYRLPSRLVAVFQSSADDARNIVSYGELADWQRHNSVFSSLDAYALNGSFTLNTPAGAEQVQGTRVSAGFFRTLGVSTALGRTFHAGEDSAATPETAIISYAAWQTRFGLAPGIVGRTLTLNGKPTTIIGVLPASFHFAPYGRADFWGTLRSTGTCESDRSCHNLIPIARLRDGISVNQASAGMSALVKRLSKEHGERSGAANLVPLRNFIIGDVQPVLAVLLTGALLLFAIAAVNVSALVLSRSTKRQHETALRAALGASRGRLIRQFTVEALALTTFGGLGAFCLASWGMRALVHLVPVHRLDSLPYLRTVGWTPLSVTFAALALLLSALLLTLIPLAQTTASFDLGGSLKEGSRGAGNRTWRRLGARLIIVEVAVATVLMAGAGLLTRSLYRLLHVQTGFESSHLLAIASSWAPGSYSGEASLIRLERRMLDELSHLPGVSAVALSNAPPIDSAWGSSSFHIVGRANRGENNEVLNRHISPSYFGVLQARLLSGRLFAATDDAHSPLVTMVNRTLARKYFGNEDPLGKQIYYDWQPHSLIQIVGVVDDIREGPLAGDAWPTLYVPYTQAPWAWPDFLVRTSGDELALAPAIARAIHRIDPLISVSDATRMTDRIVQSPAAYFNESSASLVGAFAVCAFVLTAIGLYGVVAYSVAQRAREIGIRIALGADPASMRRLILRESAQLTGLGLVSGLVISVPAATLLRALLLVRTVLMRKSRNKFSVGSIFR